MINTSYSSLHETPYECFGPFIGGRVRQGLKVSLDSHNNFMYFLLLYICVVLLCVNILPIHKAAVYYPSKECGLGPEWGCFIYILIPSSLSCKLPLTGPAFLTLALSLVQNKQKCQIKTFCCYFHSVHSTYRAFIVRECIIYYLIISLVLITNHDICSCNGSKILNVSL